MKHLDREMMNSTNFNSMIDMAIGIQSAWWVEMHSIPIKVFNLLFKLLIMQKICYSVFKYFEEARLFYVSCKKTTIFTAQSMKNEIVISWK